MRFSTNVFSQRGDLHFTSLVNSEQGDDPSSRSRLPNIKSLQTYLKYEKIRSVHLNANINKVTGWIHRLVNTQWSHLWQPKPIIWWVWTLLRSVLSLCYTGQSLLCCMWSLSNKSFQALPQICYHNTCREWPSELTSCHHYDSWRGAVCLTR